MAAMDGHGRPGPAWRPWTAVVGGLAAVAACQDDGLAAVEALEAGQL